MDKPTILIVDDRPQNVAIIAQYLTNSGNFAISMAQDGPSALQIAQQTLPELILLDVMMPGMSGFEVCSRLKENPKTAEIPIIFMTALGGTEEKIKGFSGGAVDYITKPIDLDETLARVTSHIRTYQLTQKEKVLRKEQEKLLRDKELLFGVITHDLRAPFTGLIGLMDWLHGAVKERSVSLADVEQTTGAIHVASRAVLDMLDNLLYWSQLEGGKFTFRPVAVNISEIISDVHETLRLSLEQKNIELRIQSQMDTPLMLDKTIVTTVLRNLVSNAIKFSKVGGHITLKSELEGQMLRVSVRDNGVGISTEQIQVLMDGQGATTIGTQGEKGAGLGLKLCQQMLEMHNGHLNAIGTPGKGATFYFVLDAGLR